VSIPAHVALAASLMLGGVEEQPEDTRPRIDLRGDLHGKQLEVWEAVDEARKSASLKRIRVLWSRRTGKSNVVIRIACQVASETPDGVVPYISITRKHAKINFWKLFKSIARRLDPDVKINESDLTIDFPNGGMVWLGGADKLDELDKYRASMCPLAIIDEMQRFPSDNVRYLIEEVLGPALFDLGAPLIESGTPGKTMLPGIYWYDGTGPHATDVFRANVYDNPFLHDVAERLAKLREERGWTEKTPQYRREYLGEWCDDPEGKVYPFDLVRNGIDALPERNSKGNLLDVKRWRYVVGVDPAGSGITGISVCAAHPDIVGTFVLESESHQGMMLDHLVARCRALKAKYPTAQFVMDTGGLGSTHAQEFSRKFAFYVKPAQKTERKSSVHFCHDEVVSGRMKVVNGPCNDAWRGEAAAIGWDEDHEDHEDGAIDHVCDTVLYAARELHPRVADEPLPDTRSAAKREEDRILAARLRKYQPQHGRPSWAKV
jgi:hypothetical protein